MTRPRKDLISIDETPYYHLISRCVRRAFLCGFDHDSQIDYNHRRQWIVDRIRLLSSLFAIDICSYAVMSNHYHLVIKLSPEQSTLWSDKETAERWCSIYKGPLLVRNWLQGEPITPAQQHTIDDIISVWRKRLINPSWFMKCLNEPIARQANKEDQCTGHFWESRYKSQALLNEEALLSCMVYVDLNPIRAKMADRPENSDHTSIQERIKPSLNPRKAIDSQIKQNVIQHFNKPIKPLLHFDNTITNQHQTGIPFNQIDYFKLVDWTGRSLRDDKRGSIPIQIPGILERLDIKPRQWLINSSEFERRFNQRFHKAKVSNNTS